jgi:hypothetical protein
MTRTRYFLDTEFIEDGHTIDLLSIGIICEDGRDYYAEVDPTEVDWSKANDWVVENVKPHLYQQGESVVRTLAQLAGDVLKFVNAGEAKPEFWAYYADYDWVALCQLYGTMLDLPASWPMFCMDLKQWAVHLGDPELPKQDGQEHNALADARHNLRVYRFLAGEVSA